MLGRLGTDDVIVGHHLRIQDIPILPSSATVCFDFQGNLMACGASSLRWKTSVSPFRGGLETVLKLRPIKFTWKESRQDDLGLAAEDVARVAPELTLTGADGAPTGVRYERLNILLINAVRQLERENAALRQRNATTERRLKVIERHLRTGNRHEGHFRSARSGH